MDSKIQQQSEGKRSLWEQRRHSLQGPTLHNVPPFLIPKEARRGSLPSSVSFLLGNLKGPLWLVEVSPPSVEPVDPCNNKAEIKSGSVDFKTGWLLAFEVIMSRYIKDYSTWALALTHWNINKIQINYRPKQELTNKPSAKSSQLPTLFWFCLCFYFRKSHSLSVFSHVYSLGLEGCLSSQEHWLLTGSCREPGSESSTTWRRTVTSVPLLWPPRVQHTCGDAQTYM